MPPHRAVWLVARREVTERVRDRSFTVSIAVFIGLIAAFVFVPRLLGFGGTDTYRVGYVGADSQVLAEALADQAGDDVEIELQRFDGLTAAEAALEERDIAVVLAEGEVIVERGLPGNLEALIQRAAAQRQVYEGFADRGVPATDVTALLNPPPLPVRALDPGVDPSAADTSAGFAIVVVLVLYGQLLAYGLGVASGIIEEKQTRVVEVLLSTLRPSHLLAGKVLGIGVVGLLQLTIQAGLGFTFVIAVDIVDLPPGAFSALAWTLTWFVLGYGLYASAFAIVGAICARQEELQNAATPLSLLILGALFIAFGANGDPTSTLARIGALVPFTSPMVMPVRIVRGVAMPWEIALAVALIGVAIVGLIMLAGRVYAGGALRVASRVKLRQALSAG